jgi:hypothetical protein
MIMKDGVRIGMAVGLGYLLGRTRKGRMALMLVGVGVTGRAGKNPAALLKQGVDVLGSSPQVKTLTETVRGRLVEAGKAAAVSAVSSQVDTLTGKIEERTGALSSPPVDGQAGKTDEDEDADADTGEDTDTGEDEQKEQAEGEEDNDERAAEQRPRRTAKRRPPPRRSESADEPEDDDDRADGRPRRPTRPSSQRPPVRRTRRREQ